jgi:VIT1/CCC1 family predicted Fe2+/Mn2+ transporter
MGINHSLKTGLSFGLTSGIITTMGLMVGLNSSTSSKAAVIGGIVTIAIADAFSDALGIHISEESENVHTNKEIWQSTLSTFTFKLIFALTFAIPILALDLPTAIMVNVIWGLSILGIFSYLIAKSEKANPIQVVTEHLAIATAVIAITHTIGHWIAATLM